MSQIGVQIELLRQQLQEAVAEHRGDFLHPRVLRLSQELDVLILRVQKLEHTQRQHEKERMHRTRPTCDPSPWEASGS